MKYFKLFITCILLSFGSSLHGQFYDDFSDGNLSENPKWEGDTDQFIINEAQQLQLNGDGSGRARLMTINSYNEDVIEWRFFVRLSFSPSGNNYARIYLIHNSIDFSSEPSTGYYLQLGEAGSDDVPELFYIENGQSTSICRSNFSISNSFSLYIKIIKEQNEIWRIMATSNAEGIYNEIGCCESPFGNAAPHSPHNQYFGIECIYTSGNKNKFYFDDFYCGPPIIDSIPPSILSVVPNNQNQHTITVNFSEPVTNGALDTDNYLVTEIQRNPAQCRFLDELQQSVEITFGENFTEREIYHLNINSITDAHNNNLSDTTLPFLYYKTIRNELIINEIMADPAPSVGLPESEYVELHNRLSFDVRLDNWTLRIGTNDRILNGITIPAHGYAVILSAATLDFWDNPINTYAVNSFSLADDGQKLTLLSDEGEVIHHVAYKKQWHRNPLKREGGWSLEMIDPDNPCTGAGNWDSSVAAAGGTPCGTNSILSDNKDVTKPRIEKIIVPNDHHVRVFFSEPIHFDTATARDIFHIDRGITVLEATKEPPEFNYTTLTLDEPLEEYSVYTLTLHDTICDCVGNRLLDGDFATFGMPEEPVAGDIIINEVLSNPFDDTDGDYIELYNRSGKIIDLGRTRLGVGNGDIPDNAIETVKDGFLLFPQQYAAICKNRTLTIEQYIPQWPQNIIENELIPSYPNDAGTVHLLDADLNCLDRLSYDASMHYPLLLSTDGVALERIHFDGATQDWDNWTSAAEGCGWGTPGYRNSQSSEASGGEETVMVEPEVVTPDGDGYHDFAEVFCHFTTTGQRITIDIYDQEGHRINRLADNYICGFEERFRWDGIASDGRMINNGIYIVLVKVWNLEGKTKTFRKVVSMARR